MSKLITIKSISGGGGGGGLMRTDSTPAWHASDFRLTTSLFGGGGRGGGRRGGGINGVSRADRLNGLENSKTVELQRRRGWKRESAEEQASHLSRISDLTVSE